MRRFFGLDPFDVMDEVFGTGLVAAPAVRNKSLSTVGKAFRCDVKSTDTYYVIEAELPGYNKEDISVDLNDNVLTISAETKKETEEKKENYVFKERYSGKFSRSFVVEDVDENAIKASYKDGILTLDIPKKKKEETKKNIVIE